MPKASRNKLYRQSPYGGEEGTCPPPQQRCPGAVAWGDVPKYLPGGGQGQGGGQAKCKGNSEEHHWEGVGSSIPMRFVEGGPWGLVSGKTREG